MYLILSRADSLGGKPYPRSPPPPLALTPSNLLLIDVWALG